jgi:hypothetical protein
MFWVGSVLGIVVGALGIVAIALALGNKKFPYEEED